MARERLLRLAAALPSGVSEIYFHPATEPDSSMLRVMPGYQHAAELAALLDPAVAAALPGRISYGALAEALPGLGVTQAPRG
jgi:hypothetical protein